MKKVRLFALSFAFLAWLQPSSQCSAQLPSISFGTPNSPRNEAVKLFNSGVHESKAKNYPAAIQYFQQAMQADPSLMEVHGALGQTYFNAGNYEQAYLELEQAARHAPKKADAWALLGATAARLHKYDASVAAFKQYLNVRPEGEFAGDAHRSIGIIENLMNKSPDALQGNYLADFQKENHRWILTGLPIRVFVADGSHVPGFNPSYYQALRQSFNEWTAATDGRFQFVLIGSPARAQIVVHWTNSKNDLGGANELGYTVLNYATRDAHIEHADIALLTEFDGINQPDEAFRRARAVDLHEIGHALGLQHSNEAWDIMYPMAAPIGLEFTITPRDKSTLMTLYGANSLNLVAQRFNASFNGMNRGGVQSLAMNNNLSGMNSGIGNGMNSGMGSGMNGGMDRQMGQNQNQNLNNNWGQSQNFQGTGNGGNNNIAPQQNNQSVASVPPINSFAPVVPSFQPSGQQNQFGAGAQNGPGGGDRLVALNKAATEATERGDYDGAIAKLQDAHKIAPGDQIISRNLGLALGNAASMAEQSGDKKKAGAYYQRALSVLQGVSDKGVYTQLMKDYQSFLHKK